MILLLFITQTSDCDSECNFRWNLMNKMIVDEVHVHMYKYYHNNMFGVLFN